MLENKALCLNRFCNRGVAQAGIQGHGVHTERAPWDSYHIAKQDGKGAQGPHVLSVWLGPSTCAHSHAAAGISRRAPASCPVAPAARPTGQEKGLQGLPPQSRGRYLRVQVRVRQCTYNLNLTPSFPCQPQKMFPFTCFIRSSDFDVKQKWTQIPACLAGELMGDLVEDGVGCKKQ